MHFAQEDVDDKHSAQFDCWQVVVWQVLFPVNWYPSKQLEHNSDECSHVLHVELQ